MYADGDTKIYVKFEKPTLDDDYTILDIFTTTAAKRKALIATEPRHNDDSGRMASYGSNGEDPIVDQYEIIFGVYSAMRVGTFLFTLTESILQEMRALSRK